MAKTKTPPKPRISGFCNATLPRTSAYDPHQRCQGCDCRALNCPCNPEEPMPEPDAQPPSSEVTKREPEPTDPGDAATPEECVAAAQRAAERMNVAMKDYSADHWHDAARLLNHLRKVTAMLGMLDSSLVQWLYLHGEHGLHQQVPGIPGSVNITRGRAKERWDAEGAVKAYVEAQLAETGEVPDPLQVMAWVLAVLPATQSTSLRKTPLRDAGVDLEDYYWSEPGTLQVGLPRPELT